MRYFGNLTVFLILPVDFQQRNCPWSLFHVRFFIKNINFVFIDITGASTAYNIGPTIMYAYLFNTITLYCNGFFELKKLLALNQVGVRTSRIKSHHNKKES